MSDRKRPRLWRCPRCKRPATLDRQFLCSNCVSNAIAGYLSLKGKLHKFVSRRSLVDAGGNGS